MTHPFIIAGVFALQATAPEGEPADLAMIAIGTGACEAPAEGPGSSPDQAIVTDVSELMDQARWRAEEFDFIEYFSEIHEEDVVDLNCKWVTLSGHFRTETYWHYQGRMFSDLWDTYHFFRTGFGSEQTPRLYVESFGDTAQRKFPLHSTNIAVTGFHYDLCEQARVQIREIEQDGVAVFNFGGPCHYGPTNGVMLQGVRVDELLGRPNIHLSGHSTRALIGDLTTLDRDTEIYAETHRAALEWLAQTRRGERSYLLWDWGQEYDSLEERLQDPNDWSSFLVRDIQSQLDGINADTAFAAFEYTNPNSEYESSFEETIGCFCLKDECQDADWPVMKADTIWHATDYICGDFSNRRGFWRYE